jgi:hypothetical protein
MAIRHARTLIAAGTLSLALAGCFDGVRFQVTDMTSSTSSSSGLGQSYAYRGSVLALGGTSVADNIYDVALRVTRLSGGDPQTIATEVNPFYVTVVVAKGKGTFSLYGGYRGSTESWEPPRYEVTVVGYSRYAKGAGK